MSKLRHAAVASAALIALSASGALAQVIVQPPAGSVVIAPSAPPAVRSEVVPPPPDAVAQWNPGHWNWDGYRWIWVAGRFVIPPSSVQTSGWRWIPGQWLQRPDGSWTWSEGHWG